MNGDYEPRERLLQPGRGRRRNWFLIVGIGLIALVFLISSFAKPYTDYLWYVHDAGHPEVFTLAYQTRGVLFSLSFVFCVLLFALSFGRALSVGMVYLRMPASLSENVSAQLLGWIQAHAAGATKLAAVVLAFFSAIGFSREWPTYLLWRNAQTFGMDDPMFGKDIGFFVFQLPWWLAVLSFLSSVLLLCALATLGIYAGIAGIARLAKVELSKPAVRLHIGALIGLTLMAFGAYNLLSVYEYGLIDSPQFTGAGYAAAFKMKVHYALAALTVLLGAATIVSAKFVRHYRIPVYGLGGIAAVYLLGLQMTPAILQRVYVEPNKLQVESPYAERAIKMTRWAYGLDRIDVRQTDVREEPTPDELVASQATLQGMRLWDPEVLRQCIETIQTLRPYYKFHDVDVDRYIIDGKPTLVMLSPRDIDIDGLATSARAWLNTTLQYTHGYGVTVSPVNTSTPSGEPTFLVKDMPPKAPPELKLDRPQLYFSDKRDAFGGLRDDYALVNTKVEEFEYPSEEGDKYTRSTSGRGVPVSGMLSRLAFSLVNADGNLLVSPNITPETRLLYRRNVIQRCQLIYPFLQFDDDPYIVIHEGRIVWILDAYITTGMVPYSARIQGSGGPINYIRNSVKVTIDAYTGNTTAYAMEPDNAILKAYRKIYPKLISDVDKMPSGLYNHIRYAEDMFMLQAYQLTQYHVTDPVQFLNNSDAWEMPTEIGRSGARVNMEAYYVLLQQSDSQRLKFALILPFTPRLKQNMSGWLTALCDPDDYGKMILYKYPKGSNMYGPAQMEADFNQDAEIANINKLLNTEQSEIVPGNLIVMPIGKSVLYVKPLFLRSKSAGIQPIPQLRKVILAVRGRVVVGNTYQEAFSRLFGDTSALGATEFKPPPEEPEGQPSAPAEPQADAASLSEIRSVLKLMDEAEAALKEGDLATYASKMREARSRLEESLRPR
ncbi:MAG: UPF0182 protein [Chthonomonadaceae bacterium]